MRENRGGWKRKGEGKETRGGAGDNGSLRKIRLRARALSVYRILTRSTGLEVRFSFSKQTRESAYGER